jgi:hypothetical protein
MATKTAVTEEKIGRVGQRRQVVIPREIAKTLDLHEGTSWRSASRPTAYS